MGKWLIGVDLGGTTIKFAFISEEGDILHKWSIPTNTADEGKMIIPDIANSIKENLAQFNKDVEIVKGIGIGAPAFMNMETGYIYKAVNLGWQNVDLKSDLEQLLGLPVVIENDANAAAIGEMWKGAGAQSKDLLCITLGTGVGGGLIINGDIVHGANGMAGEIGHITVVPENGVACNCGRSGCLETISSATGMVRLAAEGLRKHPNSLVTKLFNQNGHISTKMIMDAAGQNDEFAVEIVNSASYYLGLAMANIANTINPSKIVIGGGVSKAGTILIEPLTKYFKQFALPRVYEASEIKIATLGNDAGVIGCAWLVKNKL